MACRAIAVSLSVAGLALVLLGATWKHWHSPQQFWSAEQAKEWTTAWRDLKAAATGGLHPADANTNPKFAAAQARFNEINGSLERATTLNNYSGIAMIAVGAVMAAVGVALHLSRSVPTSPSDKG